jgi:predicted ATPase/DNA-binding SARP family transcriptional activator
MEFRILGPLEASDGGRQVSLGGPKLRALLALLLLHPNEVVPADRLIDELWGEDSPEDAAAALRVNVSRLRKALAGDVLTTRSPGYVLRVEPDALDLHRFERLVDEGRSLLARGLAADASVRLRDALSLWRGSALADFAYESFAQAAIARLEESRLAAVELRIEADLALGGHDELIGELEELVAKHPLRERLRSNLMTALYRSGRQADALGAYQDARRALVDELGIDPSPALQELERAILRQDIALNLAAAVRPFAGARMTQALVVGPGLVPPRLIGRTTEVEAIRRLLVRGDVRLATIIGAGGVGKTRLALAVVEACRDDFADGAAMVELAPIADPTLVAAAIARAFRLEEGEQLPPIEQLKRRLADDDFLLLVDNCEHVIEAAALLSELLAACPRLRVLATSRERLRLATEQVVPLEPLPDADAVELFRERAEAIDPGFELTDAVSEICRRLDGLPLAIELAAARTPMLPLASLLERLERRLPLLTGGRREAPERQRTMRATIDWSYELLAAEEQRLFVRLAVFAGGFTVDAACDVCKADLDSLQSLVEQSLLRRSGDRLVMLETVREYALERLEGSNEAHEVSAKHAEWVLAVGAPFEQDLGTPQLQSALPGLRAEIGNARAAVAWALEHAEPEFALRLILASWAYGPTFGEVAHWYDEALPRAAQLPSPTVAHALRDAGAVAQARADSRKAEALLLRSLAIYEELGDEDGQTRALRRLGNNALAMGDATGSRAFHEQSLALARRRGDVRGVYLAEFGLARGQHALGDSQRATQMLEHSLVRARAEGDLFAAGEMLHQLGDISLDRRAPGRARKHYKEAASMASRIGLDHLLAYCLAGLAAAAALEHDVERAGRLWGALAALDQSSGGWVAPSDLERYEGFVADGAAEAQAAYARGMAATQNLTSEEALRLVLAEVFSEREEEQRVVAPEPHASH